MVFRTCVWFPVVLRGRPETSACSSAGEPTTSKPWRPRMFVRHMVSGFVQGRDYRRPPRTTGWRAARLVPPAGRPALASSGMTDAVGEHRGRLLDPRPPRLLALRLLDPPHVLLPVRVRERIEERARLRIESAGEVGGYL